MSPVLVLVADPDLEPDEVARLRALRDEGATILAWQHSRIVQDRHPSPDIAEKLRSLDVHALTIVEALGEREDYEIDEAVIAWMKAFGKTPLGGGGSFRDRFHYGPMVLWWWAELYLYHETPLRLLIRDIEALSRLVDERAPKRIVVVRPRRRLEQAARALAVEVEVIGAWKKGPPYAVRTTLLHLADFLKMLGTGVKSLFRRSPTPVEGSPRVFFLTHASMWREKRDPVTGGAELREMYFEDILPAVAERAATTVVAFGPPVPFKARKIGARVRDVLEISKDGLPYRSIREYFPFASSLSLARAFLFSWRWLGRFRRIPEIERALAHRGVFLGEEAMACFRDTFLRQIPWAIRAYHEMESVLVAERPDVLVLYAESSGLGRAAVTAARQRGVPSFAIQHGIMYPQYYSHEHVRDEVEDGEGGVPIPTRTAVFGSLAKELLVRRGSYPESRIVITGSPKFDALVKAAEGYDVRAIRRDVGVPEGCRFLVLASRFTAVGPVFAELVRAVEALDDVWLYVKPHQAESPRAYRDIVERLNPSRTRILPGSVSLLELLFASDGLITVDSLASSEALVLGRPVLVVNLPSNLGALVERGVALGVVRGASIEEALRRLLYDERTARELEEKRKTYIEEFAFGADGRSTERIVEAILETATTRP